MIINFCWLTAVQLVHRAYFVWCGQAMVSHPPSSDASCASNAHSISSTRRFARRFTTAWDAPMHWATIPVCDVPVPRRVCAMPMCDRLSREMPAYIRAATTIYISPSQYLYIYIYLSFGYVFYRFAAHCYVCARRPASSWLVLLLLAHVACEWWPRRRRVCITRR